MKTFLLVFLISCALGKTVETNFPINSNLLMSQHSKHTIFYNKVAKVFYFIQYHNKPAITGSVSLVEYKSGSLSIRDNKGTTYVFTPNDNIVGVGSFSGTAYNDWVVSTADGDTKFGADVDGGDIEELSCSCKEDGTKNTCEHGGVGSTSCNVTDGGGAGTVNWTNTCGVSCKTGYYACCNE